MRGVAHLVDRRHATLPIDGVAEHSTPLILKLRSLQSDNLETPTVNEDKMTKVYHSSSNQLLAKASDHFLIAGG